MQSGSGSGSAPDMPPLAAYHEMAMSDDSMMAMYDMMPPPMEEVSIREIMPMEEFKLMTMGIEKSDTHIIFEIEEELKDARCAV